MTSPVNTSSDPADSDGDAALAGEWRTLTAPVAEPQTVYVLRGDVLLFPGTGQNLSTLALEKIQDSLGLDDLYVVDGIDRPWILRRADPPS